MLKTNIRLIIFSCLIILFGCGKNRGNNSTPDLCANVAFKFSTDVQPILNNSCVKCHGAGSTNSGGNLTDYSHIFAKRADIKFQIETNQMPKSSSLTVEQKNKIICWINSGAPNN